MLTALAVATATGLATGIGVIPLLFRSSLPRKVYDGILGMGAGLMISAATLGLLGAAVEEIRHDGHLDVAVLVQVLAGFALGVAAIAIMDRFVPHHHARGHGSHISSAAHGTQIAGDAEHGEHSDDEMRKGLLFSGAMTLHRIPEGFAIGAGFAAGDAHTLGWLLAIAVAFQNACEGAVMSAPLRQAGWSRRRVALTVTATGLAVPIGAAVGFLAASHIASALPLSLALASGALIYLISNEIIPETHSHGNEHVATLGLVAGFFVTIVVRSLGHAH